MHPTPRPDALTWFSAGLVVAPAAVSLVAAVALVFAMPEALRGPAGLGAALGLFGSSPLIYAEYRSILCGSRRASLLIAYLLLYCAITGSFAWLGGLLDVLHLKSSRSDSMSLGEFTLYTAFLSCVIVSGAGHLRWHRLLRRGAGT